MRSRLLLGLLAAGLLLASCSTVPITGRRQLNFIPQSEMLSMSYDQYGTFLKENKVSADPTATARVPPVDTVVIGYGSVDRTKTTKVDTRVIAASNPDLKTLIDQKKFREDLFYRLSVFPITIPPLRERRDDVEALAEHFILRFCKEMNKKPKSLSPEASTIMQKYHWPGNVRELENTIERAIILCEGSKIKPEHLARKAIVYLRQSSDKQVRQNKESQRLQYDVAERMRTLGWREVEIISSDLGCSAGIALGTPPRIEFGSCAGFSDCLILSQFAMTSSGVPACASAK